MAHGEKYVDQYKLPHNGWGDAVTEQIGNYSESDTSKITNLIASLCESAQQRETFVNDGDEVFNHTNQCPNGDQWEKYSTVAKDERIWNFFKRIDELVENWRPDVHNRNLSPADYDNESYGILVKEKNRLFKACPIGTVVTLALNLLWVRQIFKKRLELQRILEMLQLQVTLKMALINDGVWELILQLI